MKGRPAISTYTGTGAEITLELGFVPDFLMVTQTSDGNKVALWGSALPDGTSIDITGDVAPNPSNGITALADDDEGAGVILGTDFSESGKDYLYIAFSAEA